MRLVHNAGTERVTDLLRTGLASGHRLDLATAELSLFAFENLRGILASLDGCRFVLPAEVLEDGFLGGPHDRAERNRLASRWLAGQCAEWVRRKVDVRRIHGRVPQGIAVLRDAAAHAQQVIMGSFGFSTGGLGITPGNPMSLIQATETVEEATSLSQWFDTQWSGLADGAAFKDAILRALGELASHRDPSSIYALILHHLFQSTAGQMDEEEIIKSATGIRNTVVWKKLFKFQRDGVVGAIDKLNQFGGCIIADSVGLGKTFEALAIIKYYELRNDRVLVLCPKRLRDNWTLYRANDRR
ncbi:MAG TPA: SNF2-related protein, partial [Rhodanobacteraceae bacterium]|nr:SNF2-related protein [Rhodanobacteraceae bacterium]